VKPIINVDDVPLEHHAHGDKFEARDGSVGREIGARLLGCSFTVVPPGKRAWPFHNHHINEEMFVILSGTGAVRIGDREYPVRPGDVIATPPGDAGTAHQIINTSTTELRYLSVSTMIANDLVEYPDSGKLLICAGSPPGGDLSARTFSYRGRLGARAEYWDGE